MDLRAQIDPNTVKVGDPNITLSPIDRSSRQKINKEISEPLHTLEQMYIIDIYRVFHPPTRQYIFSSSAHGTFSKIDHILGHKASLNKFKKTEIPPCIIADHYRMRLCSTTKETTENI
jgi:exonuclease III